MAEPHYHRCNGDCPDGISAPAIAESVDHGALMDVIWAVRSPRRPLDSSVEVRHRYWSTHCRHGNHDACSAKWLTGPTVMDGVTTAIARMPSQCKTPECQAPCICPCHTSSTEGEAA